MLHDPILNKRGFMSRRLLEKPIFHGRHLSGVGAITRRDSSNEKEQAYGHGTDEYRNPHDAPLDAPFGFEIRPAPFTVKA
jgi:hypothetical protein